jgi:hypothetical protein
MSLSEAVGLDFDGEDLAAPGHGQRIAFVPEPRRPGLPPSGRVCPVQGIQPSGSQLVLAGILLGLGTEGYDGLAIDHGEVGGGKTADCSLDHAFLDVGALLHDLFDDYLKIVIDLGPPVGEPAVVVPLGPRDVPPVGRAGERRVSR